MSPKPTQYFQESWNYSKLQKWRFPGRNQHHCAFSPALTGGSVWAELGTHHHHLCTTANSLGYVTEREQTRRNRNSTVSTQDSTGNQGDRRGIYRSTGRRSLDGTAGVKARVGSQNQLDQSRKFPASVPKQKRTNLISPQQQRRTAESHRDSRQHREAQRWTF